jgi:dTDP-D-glucose 4,6-dehydratase
MMAVLVTGGAGYIGSHMVLELVDAGETVVVLDDLSTGVRAVLPEEGALVVGDMGDERLVARTIAEHKVEAIAHFAAKIVVPDSVSDPLGYYLNNTAKSRALLATGGRGRRQAGDLLLDRRGLWRAQGQPGARGSAARADQPLRPLQDDDGVDAAGRRSRP